MTKPIVISFCSGCMGLDLGLARSGFRVVLASETDKHARATIAANCPNLPVIGDLREYDAGDVRSAAGIGRKEDIDAVVGGPPCQPWSVAGRHRGFSDPRTCSRRS